MDTKKPPSKFFPYIRSGFIMLILLSFVLIAHTIIYLSIVTVWPAGWGVPDFALKLILTVFAVGSVVALVISSRYNTLVSRIFYRIMAVWMGFFVYFFFVSFIYGAILGLEDMMGNPSLLITFGRVLGLVAILGGVYGLIHAQPIKTKHIKLSLSGLPEFWKGKRAVFISDIHLGQIHTQKFARRVVDALKAVPHDILLIGGDLFDGVKVNEHHIVAPFAELKPIHGAYFITGNHEEFSDSTHFLTAIRSVGIRVLLNELVDVQGLQIIGVTDHDSIHKDRLTNILADLKIDRSRASILLKHQPSHVEIPESAGVSVQLSGHTHRAQQFPLNFLPYLIYKGYSYGLKQFKTMQVYTSSGVGSWGPPMRVGSASEIVVIEFV